MMKRGIRIEDRDNVATVLEDVNQGFQVEVINKQGNSIKTLNVIEDIPMGHKIALVDIPRGACVLKYGFSIGIAFKTILKGSHVHIHNIESQRGRGDLSNSVP